MRLCPKENATGKATDNLHLETRDDYQTKWYISTMSKLEMNTKRSGISQPRVGYQEETCA